MAYYSTQPEHNDALRTALNALFLRTVSAIQDDTGGLYTLTLNSTHNFQKTANFADSVKIYKSGFWVKSSIRAIPTVDKIQVYSPTEIPSGCSVNLFNFTDHQHFLNEYVNENASKSYPRSDFPICRLLSVGQYVKGVRQSSSGNIFFDGFIYRLDILESLQNHADTNGETDNSTAKRAADHFCANRMMYLLSQIAVDGWIADSWVNSSNFSENKKISLESIGIYIPQKKLLQS